MGTPTKLANWWQYSRWVYIVGRTLRFNYGTVGEITAVKTFLNALVAGRPWLVPVLGAKTGPDKTITTSSSYDLSKMVMVSGRDLKKIPLTDAEKTLCDNLFTATGNRRYGAKGNLI